MYRAIVEPFEEGWVTLPTEEAHHLTRVRRARPGTRFLGLAPPGVWLVCELERQGRDWLGRVIEQLADSNESPLRITLAQALIKKDKFEWILQKSVELGVNEIVPLLTRRTEIRTDERKLGRKQERWRKILVEAVKQCGRTRVPVLQLPVELKEFARQNKPDLLLVLDEESGQSIHKVLDGSRGKVHSVTALVGPEGGWDPLDRVHLAELQGIAIRLGPRILRSETAPLAVLAILQYELGDLGGRGGAANSKV